MFKKRTSTLLLTLTLTLAFSGCGNSKPKEKPVSTDNKLDKIVNSYIKYNNFTGTILIGKEGKILYKKAFGMADYDKKIPNTIETQFRIASLTKEFTATGIMLLQEQGKLSTEDPLSKYIPDFKQGDKVKIHHLLTHSSGVEEYSTTDNIHLANNYCAPNDIVTLIKNKALIFEPGSKFEYNNSNYALLGYIIEKVSNMKYEDFINEHFLKPLNMTNTIYDVKNTLTTAAKGYVIEPSDSKPTAAEFRHPSFGYAAYGLHSTVEDLYKWDQALYSEKIIKKSSLDKMFTAYISGYGYGWYVNKIDSSLSMYHYGLAGGYSSYFYRNINEKVTIIILSNNRNSTKTEFKVDDVLKALK